MKSYKNWVEDENGHVYHRPLFKVLINKFLRIFQKSAMKFVIYSKSNMDTKGWYCYGYGFGRVFHNQSFNKLNEGVK